MKKNLNFLKIVLIKKTPYGAYSSPTVVQVIRSGNTLDGLVPMSMTHLMRSRTAFFRMLLRVLYCIAHCNCTRFNHSLLRVSDT